MSEQCPHGCNVPWSKDGHAERCPYRSTKAAEIAAIERLAELCETAHEQIGAAMRSTYGLPLAAIESDTYPGKLGLWCDNGLAGIGQVAVFTDEFPVQQASGICALANNAAALRDVLPLVAVALRAHLTNPENSHGPK